MKKKYFILTAIVFFIGVVFIGCNNNRDNTQENVKQENQNMVDIQVQHEQEWQKFKSDAELRINSNQKIIDDFKLAMKKTSDNFKAKYQNEVLTLEQKNIELRKKINEYQNKGNENWEEFKKELNDDIYTVEKALKDIFEKKE